MLRAFLVSFTCLLAAPFAAAGPGVEAGQCAGADEAACLFEAIWSAAGALPADKQARLKPVFIETVALSGDPALLQAWQTRLSAPARHAAPRIDYAADQARAVLAESGWTGFLSRARAGTAPFNIGRPEIMAAGVRLAPDDATKRRLIETMFDLAHSKTTRGGMGDDFEKGDFGHALAELSMQRCDLAGFDRAVALTPAPDSLRYALWRTRITGQAGRLAPRIRAEADAKDTRHVRSALEGYAPIVSLGYCGR